jgi:ERF superfamily
MATQPQPLETQPEVHHLPKKRFPRLPKHAIEQVALTATPIELLRIAVSQRADLDQLTKLMDLQERWEANEARKAFHGAMKKFKSNPPRIIKNHHVHYQPKDATKAPSDYNHATLDKVCDAIIGALSECGISHRWKVDQTEKDWIKVTCILTHESGHSEETTLMGAPDQTGSKNSIQAIGSTVTYLQRYTLLAATGLAAANQDNDGRGAAQQGIPEPRVEEMCGELSRSQSLDQLRKVFTFCYREAEDAKDRAAMTTYIRVKDARKKELQ